MTIKEVLKYRKMYYEYLKYYNTLTDKEGCSPYTFREYIEILGYRPILNEPIN